MTSSKMSEGAAGSALSVEVVCGVIPLEIFLFYFTVKNLLLSSFFPLLLKSPSVIFSVRALG